MVLDVLAALGAPFSHPTAATASLMAAAGASLGVGAASLSRGAIAARAPMMAAFAAALVVSIALFHLLPEAYAHASRPALLVGAGFAGALAVSLALSAGLARIGRGELALGVAPLLAIALHSFIDGLTYAAAFAFDARSGLLATAGLILHEIPEGVIAFTFALAAGLRARAAALAAFLVAGVTTPLGAVLAGPVVARLGPGAINDLFAVTTGVLLCVGAVHLAPRLRLANLRASAAPLAAGVAVAFAAIAISGGGHAHGPLLARNQPVFVTYLPGSR